MTRYFFWLVVLVVLVPSIGAPPAVASGELISAPSAATHGLTSAWFNQIQLDSARGQVAYVTLHDAVQRDAEGLVHNPTLFIQTNQAILHAIDAINGRTLWIAQVGNPRYPSLAPGANNFFVAVANGSSLYVLNRFNGKLLFSTKLPGVPGAGPALSEQRSLRADARRPGLFLSLAAGEGPVDGAGQDRRPQEDSRREAGRGSRAARSAAIETGCGRARHLPFARADHGAAL